MYELYVLYWNLTYTVAGMLYTLLKLDNWGSLVYVCQAAQLNIISMSSGSINTAAFSFYAIYTIFWS